MLSEEAALYAIASEELGGTRYTYLSVGDDRIFRGGAATHHSLLLREERLLHESLFKRRDGVDVLFATSTLAQGMNLPSEVVIISGDSRFEPNAGRMARLEAHELLNAAGRAGRAGENSQGFVLVVPSRVVEFDVQGKKINEHWMALQSVFAQSDQCLEIDDPLTALLDMIHAGISDQGMPAYLVSRLPPVDGDGSDVSLRNVLGRSLGAFRARQRGEQVWVESRVDAAFIARNQAELAPGEGWLGKVSGLTGVPISTLKDMDPVFAGAAFDSITSARDALLSWLAQNPGTLLELVRPGSMEGLFGGQFGALPTMAKKGEYALPIIKAMLERWMSGEPLCAVEEAHPDPDDAHCKHARHFVLRVVPDLAFIAELPARLSVARNQERPPLVIASMGAAVREGCDSPECLAVRVLSRSMSRIGARKKFEKLKSHFEGGQPMETFEQTIGRARAAEQRASSSNI